MNLIDCRRNRISPRILQMESLERRQLFASDWQNASLIRDVNASGEVNSLDALILVNYLNSSGVHSFDGGNREASDNFFDVNGDHHCSPLDLLSIINAINAFSNLEPVVVGGLAPDSDPNNSGVVQHDRVDVSGQTLADSVVELFQNGSLSPIATTHADDRGNFSFQIGLEYGLQKFQLHAKDNLGRNSSAEFEVRRGNAIQDFNAAALNVIRQWSTVSDDPYLGRIVPSQPPRVARNLAMIHTAMFDAVNAVSGTYVGYATNIVPQSNASAEAAAASAAYEVAKSLYSEPDEIDVWKASYDETLATVRDGDAKSHGIELGKQAGRSILSMRANDGSKSKPTYEPIHEVGRWNRTYPDYLPPLLAQWPDVTPFVLTSGDEFRPPPPPAFNSPEYAEAVDQVMRLGALNSSDRTSEQTEIAAFWADSAGTATPPGHWNRIATDVTLSRHSDLLESARTFALMNLAMADAGIASWDSKYYYDLWRPIDAIRNADHDGNDATTAQADWLPLLKTPPFPTYTSGHSTFSGAASAVLAGLFGDATSFDDTTDPHPAPETRPLASELIATRHFKSFSQAANEAGLSRVYGGIHFNFDNTAGLELGKRLAEHVLQRLKQAY